MSRMHWGGKSKNRLGSALLPTPCMPACRVVNPSGTPLAEHPLIIAFIRAPAKLQGQHSCRWALEGQVPSQMLNLHELNRLLAVA